MREYRGFHVCDGEETVVVDGKEYQGKWVSGEKIECGVSGRIFIKRNGDEVVFNNEKEDTAMLCLWEVLTSTVGQSTGLKDKNGKEIFEGDIISCEQYVGGNYIERHIEKGYVGSKRGSFGLVRKQGFYYSFSYLLSHDFELEVTGTIHDKEV